MKSHLQSPLNYDSSLLNQSEYARACCLAAREHEERGDFGAAREAIKTWWQMGQEPRLAGLDPSATAEIYLRAGVLCGAIGSADQIAGALKTAQGLIHSATAVFKLLHQTVGVAESKIELGYCLWREGSFDQARLLLQEGLDLLPETEVDLRIVGIVRNVLAAWSGAQLSDALCLLDEAAALVPFSVNHSVRGRYHLAKALALKTVGETQKNPDYIDRALIEYAAAGYYFEQIGHTRYCAAVANNLGSLYRAIGRFDEAHQHLLTAHRLFTELKDSAHTAQVNETRSRLLIEERRYREADRVSEEAVAALVGAGQQALLVEALTTRGVVLARLDRRTEAQNMLNEAYDVAESCRDRKGAARAMMSQLEEIFDDLSYRRRAEALKRAADALAASQDPVDLSRLSKCQAAVVAAEQERERQRVREEEALRRQAYFDPLTGLPNRRFLTETLHKQIEKTLAVPNYGFGLMYLDLDRIKQINDNYGHSAGDQALIQIAKRLESCLRAQDSVARVGGDEFVIVLPELGNAEEAARVCERIQKVLEPRIALGEHEVFCTASMGMALSLTGCESPEHMLKNADEAMYQAKRSGRGRYELFDREMHDKKVRLQQLEHDLRQAVDNQEFHLNYQPIVHIGTGELAGFEALVRWKHPQWGFVSPADFIPVAEETGTILRLGQWVLQEACRQMKQWQRLKPEFEQLMISVNLSSKQLTQRDLVEEIRSALIKTDLRASALKLEITESAVTENEEVALEKLEELNALGIQLSLDDFGTGQSSLNRLRRYPVKTLKIDRSFVSDIDTEEGYAFVETIVALAKNLKLKIVAEGVEESQQLRALSVFGCEYAQGYLLAKPLASSEAEKLIKSEQIWTGHFATTEEMNGMGEPGSPECSKFLPRLGYRPARTSYRPMRRSSTRMAS